MRTRSGRDFPSKIDAMQLYPVDTLRIFAAVQYEPPEQFRGNAREVIRTTGAAPRGAAAWLVGDAEHNPLLRGAFFAALLGVILAIEYLMMR